MSTTIGGFLDGLSLRAIKESGPSPGEGHKFTNQQTLGGIKKPSPSPPFPPHNTSISLSLFLFPSHRPPQKMNSTSSVGFPEFLIYFVILLFVLIL
ncbi:unnamed protein product [Prunus brigantina]